MAPIDGCKIGLLVANYANWKGLFPMFKTLFTAVLRFVSRVFGLKKARGSKPVETIQPTGQVSNVADSPAEKPKEKPPVCIIPESIPENRRAIFAYESAVNAEKAKNRPLTSAWWAVVVELCLPSTLRSAESGGLERRALGVGRPEAYLRRGTDQKTFEQLSQRERKHGLGAYISAHKGYQRSQDAEAAAIGSYSRAFFKLVEHTENGYKPHFRHLNNPEATDKALRGYFGSIAARMLREEIYGRHRWEGHNGQKRKPVSLGDQDVDDGQPEPVEALAETELVNSLLGEIANVLAFRDQAFVEAWAHKFDPKRANGEGENKWWELCGKAKSTANKIAAELQDQLKEVMASYDNDIAAKAFKVTIDTLING